MPEPIAIDLPGGGSLTLSWSADMVRMSGELPGLSFDLKASGHWRPWEPYRATVRNGDVRVVHPLTLVHRLREPGPGRREALLAVAAMLPTGVAELYALLPEAAVSLGSPLGEFYHSDAGSPWVGLALRHPALSVALPSILERTGIRDRDGVDGRSLLSAYAPRAAPAMASRILSTGWVPETKETLDALLEMPPDWFPEDAGERRAFENLVSGCRLVASTVGYRTCLEASRGRWAEYAGRLHRKVDAAYATFPEGTRLRRASLDALDVPRAFAVQALAPALAAAGAIDGEPDGSRPRRRLAGRTGLNVLSPTVMEEVAERLLYGRVSLGAVIETSASWHGRRATMDAALAGVAERHPPRSGRPSGRWPVPFPPSTAPNGVEIRFLSSVPELASEGADGPDAQGIAGLSHCVGGYGPRCASGSGAVASLRLSGPDGTVRLSTALVSVGPSSIVERQHSALRNGPPPPEAREALAWLAGEVSSGRVRPDPGYLSASWRRDADNLSVEDACGYDWRDPAAVAAALSVWAPFLPRPLRTPEALAAAAAGTPASVRPLPPRATPHPRRGGLARRLRDGIQTVAFLPAHLAEPRRPGERMPSTARRLATLAWTETAMLGLAWCLAGPWAPAALLVLQAGAYLDARSVEASLVLSRPFRAWRHRRKAMAIAAAVRRSAGPVPPPTPSPTEAAHA